jgi:hypothetical protein
MDAPTLASAHSLTDFVAFVVAYINIIIPVLVSIAVMLFLYAGVRYIYKAEETKGKGAEREAMMWGLVALFILFSVWGILRIMCSVLIGTANCANAPQSALHPSGSNVIQLD